MTKTQITTEDDPWTSMLGEPWKMKRELYRSRLDEWIQELGLSGNEEMKLRQMHQYQWYIGLQLFHHIDCAEVLYYADKNTFKCFSKDEFPAMEALMETVWVPFLIPEAC